MGIRSVLSKPLAAIIVARQRKWATDPVGTQQRVLEYLVKKASNTAFGKDHSFSSIKTPQDWAKQVPVRDYEALSPYIERILKGEEHVLWPGKPAYFAKTSGTTSGIKYIPITADSIPYHIAAARDALFNYIHETGSPEMEMKHGIHIGRLSGIVNHHVPGWLKGNQLPSYETNCMDDWEDKLDKIIDETVEQPMSLISGIPPWVQMYFDRIIERTGKKIKDVFPNFELLVYGGVNFEPYKARLFESIGKQIPSIETYPASEGFIAFQDSQKEPGLLLLLNSGIFYEFIPADEYFNPNPTRLTIGEVELGVNYAVIMNTNAGLYGYSIGDTVKFVSKAPYRIVVSGRIKHFISAFGEHVIGEEVEKAMKATMAKHSEVEIVEFTVAPQVAPKEGLPHHEWLVEFAQEPKNLKSFSADLDEEMVRLNVYYKDLITGNILSPLKVSVLEKDAFRNYMKSQGKLGGQNKVPRLANERNIAEGLKLKA
jgi:hypothetical protein